MKLSCKPSGKISGLEDPVNPFGWDDHLRLAPPEALAGMKDAWVLKDSPADCRVRSEYAHLRETGIDLGEADLTDRQLIAVTLVFYGGVTRKRAARAMKISQQSLNEHVAAALKKIQKSLA
ncbi:MAG: hypothetical protein ACE5E9_14290 [Nitrospinaceae bacterium]